MAPAVTKQAAKAEEIRVLISEILDRIKGEEDPDVLNEYRAYVRKNVPFFMRSYFAAYLFMSLERAVPSSGGRSDKRRNQRDRKTENAPRVAAPIEREKPKNEGDRKPKADKAAAQSAGIEKTRNENRMKEAERRAEEPRRSLPEDEAATLFVSAGRNRRAYARELLALIVQESGVDKEDIGELRILDNFSFIQVRKGIADEIISSLDGKDFRGRPLSVSYAKPKKEDSPRQEAVFADEDGEAPAEGFDDRTSGENSNHSSGNGYSDEGGETDFAPGDPDYGESADGDKEPSEGN